MPNEKGGLLGGILSALPFVGNIANLLIQRKWAKQDLAAQNAYNDPAAQAARLRAAGFSPNMIYGGGSPGGQSAQPRETTVSPDLGTAETLSKFTLNAIEKQQLALIKAQTTKTDAEAAEAQGRTDFLKTTMSNRGGYTNQETMLDTKIRKDQADLAGATIENDIRGLKKQLAQIDVNIQSETGLKKARLEIDKFLKQNRELDQRFRDTENRNALINSMINALRKNGISGLDAILGSMAIKILK